jgi:hypothetical protein
LSKFDLFLKFAPIKKEISTTFPQFQAIKDATGVYGSEAVQIKENLQMVQFFKAFTKNLVLKNVRI